jgi:transcriptional regulator with XRE-family HTH domain
MAAMTTIVNEEPAAQATAISTAHVAKTRARRTADGAAQRPSPWLDVANKDDDVGSLIAANVRSARNERGWSLRELAAQTGLSKAILSNIERGKANPALETLTRIARGLDIPISRLIEPPGQGHVIRRGDDRPTVRDRALTLNFLFASADHRGFELYELNLPAGESSAWHNHLSGTRREYLYVVEGRLLVGIAGEEHRLGVGDAMIVRADLEHSYAALDGSARVLCVVGY